MSLIYTAKNTWKRCFSLARIFRIRENEDQQTPVSSLILRFVKSGIPFEFFGVIDKIRYSDSHLSFCMKCSKKLSSLTTFFAT